METLSPSDCQCPIKWWQRHFCNLVHLVFVCTAVLFFAAPIKAQRPDGVVYERLREQERHIDNSDVIAKESKAELQSQINDMRKTVQDDHETLDNYKFAFVAVSGALTLISLFGFRLSFIRGKESNG